MYGQSLFSKAYNLVTTKLILNNNRINSINVMVSHQGLKHDASSQQHQNNNNLPEKPKRPLSSFFHFTIENRAKIVKANPTARSTEIMKLIGKQWSELNAETKEKYQNAAFVDRERYNTEIERFNANLTKEQEEFMDKIDLEKRKDRKRRRTKREAKLEGKPKRPSNSFALFLKQFMKPGQTINDIIEPAKAKWNSLSDYDKEKYAIQYQQSKNKYDADLSAWETKMLHDGKKHLVRISTLKKKGEDITTKKIPYILDEKMGNLNLHKITNVNDENLTTTNFPINQIINNDDEVEVHQIQQLEKSKGFIGKFKEIFNI